jgi:3-oxoacyl-[acyl-carrier-protein] synthase-1/3-oxoacyl-[acyl-carrier-protein] synthase II
MSDVALLAFGAVSALGEGRAAVCAGEVGAAARVAIALDAELAQAGLTRPFAARALGTEEPRSLSGPDREPRACALLVRALTQCTEELEVARPGWRGERVGLVLGTSSGGMREAERAFAALAAGEHAADPEAATYVGPMARAVRRLGRSFDPTILVLGACASSAIAVGLGVRCLERGACDVVLAGGFDEVTVFVAAGFEALRATTAAPPPRPFRVGRDGTALGEGAAVLALALARRPESSTGRLFVIGFGAASDAVHITAPDRDGEGLARAARAALEEAGRPVVDLVSPHATATPFNDAAEARALRRVLADRPAPVVHPFKAQIGHTLGAAGALELLACADAIARGILPASAGAGELDPQAPVRMLDVSSRTRLRVGLKLAAAFGGANAALVVAAQPGRTRTPRPAYVGRAVYVDRPHSPARLAEATGVHVDRLARADGLVHLAMTAVAELAAADGALAGAGIVVGSPFATVETNASFAARIRRLGARAAEPRSFVYTSPNAVAGECSIAFGLTGPSFSVGGGLHAGLEALAAAALLVESSDAERVVVVAADEGGPVTRALAGGTIAPGAVACVVGAEAHGAWARVGEARLTRGVAVAGPIAAGHRALLPLVRDPRSPLGPLSSSVRDSGPHPPLVLTSASPPDALAVVRLEPV